jgi:hypothetical protein
MNTVANHAFEHGKQGLSLRLDDGTMPAADALVLRPFHPDHYEYEEIEPRHRGFRHRREPHYDFFDFS